MSRSYKKTPKCGDENSKFMKNLSNRRLRRMSIEELPLLHRSYRKANETYEICDYKDVGTSFEQYWQDLLESWYHFGKYYGYPFPDKEKAKKNYNRWYLRK